MIFFNVCETAFGLWGISAILFCVSVFGQSTFTKNVGDFRTLKVYNGIEVELIKSDEQKLVISGLAQLCYSYDDVVKLRYPKLRNRAYNHRQ